MELWDGGLLKSSEVHILIRLRSIQGTHELLSTVYNAIGILVDHEIIDEITGKECGRSTDRLKYSQSSNYCDLMGSVF